MNELFKTRYWSAAAVVLVLLATSFTVPAMGAPEVEPGTELAGDVAITTTVNLRIRSGPSISYGTLGYVLAGNTLKVLGRNSASTWVYIESNGVQGWMSTWRCIISGDLASAPVTSVKGSLPSKGDLPRQGSATDVTVVPRYHMRLRSGPGLGYTQIGGVVRWSVIPVLGRNEAGDWVYIEFNGKRGWMAAWYSAVNGDLMTVPVVDPSGVTTGSVATQPTPAPEASTGTGSPQATPVTNLNFRAGPGTSYAIITYIPSGTPVPVVGKYTISRGDWFLVEYKGQQGWIAGWYTRTAGSMADVPQVDPPAAASAPSAPAPSVPQAAAQPYTGVYANIGPHLRTIYQRGQALGNNPNVVAKVGDCETISPYFLYPFAENNYNLDKFSYLQPTLDAFKTSFYRTSVASNGGFTIEFGVLDPIWANPNQCLPGESPYECELRIMKPSVVLIMFRPGQPPSGNWDALYYEQMKVAVQYAIDKGVIPVLSTPSWAYSAESHNRLDDLTRYLAAEFNVPLWDYHATLRTLPGQGIKPDTHLTYPENGNSAHFSGDYLSYGMNRRNLEALEILHAIMAAVR